MGRPSEFTQEVADRICSELSEGKSLRTVCLAEEMPDKATVFRWLRENKSFCDQYTQAKDESALADEEILQDLGDEAIRVSQEVDAKAANAVVSAYKLKADNLKWAMSKKKPKKYGDKVDMTTNGKDLPLPLLSYVSNVPTDTVKQNLCQEESTKEALSLKPILEKPN